MDEALLTPHAAAIAHRLDRPIVLVGMMGTGKTSLGRKLAAAFDWPFADADEEIEAAAKMTIPEIFVTYGEAHFRDGERRVIARLLNVDDSEVYNTGPYSAKPPPSPQRRIIATGGGAFCNASTRALILDRAIALWLDADLDTLVERTARKDNRPLLRQGDPREILARLCAERMPFYAQAPIHVKSDSAPHIQTLLAVIDGLATWQANHAALPPIDPPQEVS